MPLSDYEVIIGLEVHAQLRTRSKLFCACPVEFRDDPNRNVCPVCLGLPGVLPVLNGTAVELALRTAVALDCRIARRSRFTRKHYFYPDLPKGYQITQYTEPLGSAGRLAISGRSIAITRLILEEDAGKSIHTGAETLVDFNRCGVPLIEITTEPDFRSPDEVVEYLSRLRQILQYLDVSDADMEKGQYRCEPNISLRPRGTAPLGVRTEVKNLNSLKAVRDAIDFEVGRQAAIIDQGGAVVQETLLWDDLRSVAEPMRGKEESADYRYFPEPDLPPLEITSASIEETRLALVELPHVRQERLVREFSLPASDAALLTGARALADYYEAVLKNGADPKLAANWIVTEVRGVLNERKTGIDALAVPPRSLSRLLGMVKTGAITSKAAKTVFSLMVETGEAPDEIVAAMGLERIDDDQMADRAIEAALAVHPDTAEKFKKGKTTVVEFILGEVMRQTRGTLNPGPVRERIIKRLSQ